MYILPSGSYSSKQKLKKRLQEILGSVPIGEKISQTDFLDIMEVLKNHPEYEEKIGVGVECVMVSISPTYRTRCMYLCRKDGTKADFSYLSCLAPKTGEQNFKQACRLVVSKDIEAFKKDNFTSGMLCPILGIEITEKNVHIDHAAPKTFEELLKAFVSQEGLNVKDVLYCGKEDRTEFKDKILGEKFLAYHREHAVLRVVSKEANLGVLRHKAA